MRKKNANMFNTDKINPKKPQWSNNSNEDPKHHHVAGIKIAKQTNSPNQRKN